MNRRAKVLMESGLPLRLKSWRTFRKMTQTELANEAGVSQGLISQLEGGSTDYSGKTLKSLARALKCSVTDLLFRQPTDPDDPWHLWDRLSPGKRRTARALLAALASEPDL